MRVLASLVSGKPVGEVTRKTSVDTFDGQIGYDVQIILLSRKSVHLDSIFFSSPPLPCFYLYNDGNERNTGHMDFPEKLPGTDARTPKLPRVMLVLSEVQAVHHASIYSAGCWWLP